MVPLNIKYVFHPFTVAEGWRVHYYQVKAFCRKFFSVLQYICMNGLVTLILRKVYTPVTFGPGEIGFGKINRNYFTGSPCNGIHREGTCITKQVQNTFAMALVLYHLSGYAMVQKQTCIKIVT